MVQLPLFTAGLLVHAAAAAAASAAAAAASASLPVSVRGVQPEEECLRELRQYVEDPTSERATIAAKFYGSGVGTACTCSTGIRGILLMRAGRPDVGAPALLQAMAATTGSGSDCEDDWITASYHGAAMEFIARKLSVNAPSDDAASLPEAAVHALQDAVRSFATAAARRQRLAQNATSAALPHTALAQPATMLYRSWGQSLQWLGRDDEARAVYAAGVRDPETRWSNVWARPTDAFALFLPAPQPLFEQGDFAVVTALLARLESALPAVRAEFTALMHADGTGAWLAPEEAGLHSQRSWRALPLMLNGITQRTACARAPATCAALAHEPWARVARGQAKFSVMWPGTHVRAHAGPTNARLRVHCTLTLFRSGAEAARLRVGNASRHWVTAPGRACFAFDESFEHEVTTAASRAPVAPGVPDVRAVLLVDIVNPFLADDDAFVAAIAPSRRDDVAANLLRQRASLRARVAQQPIQA